MGFTLKEIQESLSENRYDEVCATYMLLKRESSSSVNISINIIIILSAFTHMQISFIHTATQVDHMYIIYNTATGIYTTVVFNVCVEFVQVGPFCVYLYMYMLVCVVIASSQLYTRACGHY